MKRYLPGILILTFFISSAITTALTFISLSMSQIGQDFCRCDMSIMLYTFNIFQIIILTIGSIIVFLNLNKKIRGNFFYSLVSFLLVPLTIALLEILYFKNSVVMGMYSIMFIPFFSVLIIFFLRFRKLKCQSIKITI